MSIYKQAIRKKIRVTTPIGILDVESLFDLNFSDLEKTIRSVKEKMDSIYPDSEELSFLDSTNKIDSEISLVFEVLKDIYITKKEEKENERTKRDIRDYNNRIDTLIAEKREEELKNKSIEELEKLRK